MSTETLIVEFVVSDTPGKETDCEKKKQLVREIWQMGKQFNVPAKFSFDATLVTIQTAREYKGGEPDAAS